MKISLIHPSRSRPEQAKATANKWLSSAYDRDNIEYILSVDITDPKLHQYHNIGCCNDNHSAIEAINNAAKVATGDLFIVISDDFSCPFHWDKMLLAALKGKSDFIVKTQDGAQPWIMTMPIMDRVYYNRFGYVYNSVYKHMFCDCELAHVAEILGKTITLQLKFPHHHYTTGKTAKDAINVKNDATWAQGEAVYLERLLNYFDIPEHERVNPIDKVPKHHADWLATKGIVFEHA